MRNYTDYLHRKQAEFGAKFDPSNLDERFVPYFESGERIKVSIGNFALTGTIGVTTGWRPAFLLLRTSRAMGSPWLLGKQNKVLAVKRGQYYQEFR